MTGGGNRQHLTALVGQALQRHQAGDFAGAEALYQRVLEQDPKYADALHLYGCLVADLKRHEQAIDLIMRAIECNRNAYPYHYNLANLLAGQGRLEDAVRHYRTAIRLKPDYAQAYNNLGLALARQGDRAGAMVCYRKAIRSLGTYPDPHYNLGLALSEVDDLSGAITSYREAIRMRPGYADAWYNLGNAYSLTQRPGEAESAYREAIRIRPDNPKIHTNLGSVLLKQGRLDEAVASFRAALRLDPVDVLNHSNLILAASYASPDPAAMYAECEQWDRIHGAPLRSGIESYANVADPERRLRIAYVSADFRHHAAAYWIEPLLAGHGHENFEICCYSNSAIVDEVTERIRAYADTWVECATLDDAALAARIRSDRVDILVDLSGHTDGNRMLVFARQPAPVQVSWFGFPVSTGLKSIQYRFTDAIMDPEGENDQFYAEKLIRLPRFYASFRPEANTPEPGDGPVTRNTYVTFASLNNLAKITPAMMESWAEILRAIPDARLLFQSAGLEGEELCDRIRKFFAERGVSEQRLILRGWSGLDQFLALGKEADISLDPFPFNGGVTTCHALWMGLPVVTLSGQSAASRVGKSILSGIGLTDLVAESPMQYVDTAVALARDHDRLAKLRATLRDRMSAGGLLDGAGLAREVETAYRHMWRSWCTKR
ncbi:MAG: tetratricopeptide repeat protein [Pseudomonadota bacterium]